MDRQTLIKLACDVGLTDPLGNVALPLGVTDLTPYLAQFLLSYLHSEEHKEMLDAHRQPVMLQGTAPGQLFPGSQAVQQAAATAAAAPPPPPPVLTWKSTPTGAFKLFGDRRQVGYVQPHSLSSQWIAEQWFWDDHGHCNVTRKAFPDQSEAKAWVEEPLVTAGSTPVVVLAGAGVPAAAAVNSQGTP